MTGQQLKNSILQWAIQGKLVPQDPTDEPASKLLEKSGINLSKRSISTDNSDLPRGWVFATVRELFQLEMGQSPDGNSINTIKGFEFHQGKVFFGNKYLLPSSYFTSSPKKMGVPHSIILSVRAPVGDVNILDREICIGRGLCCLLPTSVIDLKFAYYSFLVKKSSFESNATGSTFKSISKRIISEEILPLPPLEEQKRIVARIEELMPLVEQYDKAHSEWTRLNDQLPEQLKKSILQEAIQGKLVPQDPTDEPASVLLERIRTEKVQLIKEGKIKKGQPTSHIYRDDEGSYYEKVGSKDPVCINHEIPFDLPPGWEWCRLGSLVDFRKNQSVKADEISKDAWLLDLEDIEKDTGTLLQRKRMGSTTSISNKHRFIKGNVLYSKLRPYLNKVIIADEDGYCTSEILCLDFGLVFNKYAQVYLMSPMFVEYAMSCAYGVKMPRLGSEHGNNALYPLPPLEEQKRIVARIEELMPRIDKLR